MNYLFIGIRNGKGLTHVFGPAPEAEARRQYKACILADHQAASDGQFHGVLELYELRARRSYKLRGVEGSDEPAPTLFPSR